jgi:hypothetical protein
MMNKSLTSFTLYMKKHPEQRFFQALRNWAGVGFIWAGNSPDGSDMVDTFYWRDDGKEKL